ncbi:hypothetical protein SCLCIDRAFT_104409 [Scleroderma citrinum Foug A]|uniref:RING-type domain-containing protein n=1 Tax=Scleroderma citrinum Foug A TaxID=1036808 RepID=A0A0C3A5V0_9AGAM|nr:hypothetical protein SCLCIDRAFT_104409 [Scleroderma citrinum Foug A]
MPSYVEPPNSNLICCICHAPFTNPTTTRTCMHTFCYDCITEAVRHSPQCPIDRLPLSTEDLSSSNPIVKHLVDELLVECLHSSAGCAHICQRQLLESHLKHACPYVTVPCPEIDCDQSDHYSECSSEVAACSLCTAEFPRSKTLEHIATCPNTEVPCVYVDNGCFWAGPRHELASAHIPSCPYEALKGFFTNNTVKMSALMAENATLQQRVQSLEGLVQIMQREMQFMKSTLGPWYRFETQQLDRMPATFGSDDSHARVRPITSPDIISQPLPMTDPIDTVHPPIHPADVDDAAAYFSVPDPAYPEGHRRTPSAHRPFGAILDAQAHAHQQLLLLPVSPLNLGTSLEGTLSGLRESIAATSASVESFARRNDIALTTESMRINEELGSLRYAIQGVRLQLHRLMMDRNAQVSARPSEPLSAAGLVPILPATLSPTQPVAHLPMMTPPFPGCPGTKL